MSNERDFESRTFGFRPLDWIINRKIGAALLRQQTRDELEAIKVTEARILGEDVDYMISRGYDVPDSLIDSLATQLIADAESYLEAS